MKMILLSQGKFAVVDDIDYEWLMRWSWCAVKSDKGVWYAVRTDRTGREKQVRMHREIMNAPDGIEVDHKDNDGLHNWRDNLRECTHAQNLSNRGLFSNSTTGYKGVSIFRQNGKVRYQAKIRVDGKLIHLGLFDTDVEAAKAYDAAAPQYFGEFARLNFPE